MFSCGFTALSSLLLLSFCNLKTRVPVTTRTLDICMSFHSCFSRSAHWKFFAVLVLGGACSVVAARPATVSHVVHMSLDGLGAKYLEFYVTNAPDQFPNFVRLRAEGASTMNARCDHDISETVPNHATMFTARPVMQPANAPITTHHGYNNNFPGASDTLHNSGNTNVPYKASFFDVAHDHGLTTALYTGKTRLAICERSYDGLNGAFDLFGEDDGRDKIDFAAVADVSGASISNEVNQVVADLSGAEPKQYSFIHIAEPDLTGHASGWGSANWSNAVRMVDFQLGRILDAIRANPVLDGSTGVIIAADHGGGGVTPNAHTESYHITNYTIPFFLWGPGVTPGADLYSLFTNRADPGTNRVDYSVLPQPLRGGDGGNLALALLGLPAIPNSYFLPELRMLQPPITVSQNGTLMTVWWPADSEGFFLEYANDAFAPVWHRVSSGIVNHGELLSYTFDLQVTREAGFFRLRTSGLAITSQPRPATAFAGNPATFQVGARGSGPLRYQWYRGNRRVIGATNSVLTIPLVTAADVASYRVVVADYRDSATSDDVHLTALTVPVITRQPTNQVVASNGVARFSVEAMGGGTLSYQWKRNGEALPGATAANLSVEPVSLSLEGDYTVVVSDVNGSIESSPARLAVAIPPVFLTQPISQTVNAGGPVTFTVTVSGNPPPFSFEWRRGFVVVASNVVNSTTDSVTITNAQAADAGQYRVICRNAALPVGRISTTATLTVLTNAAAGQ